MHEGETTKQGWPDLEAGPWEIETTTAIIGGRWELVGLTIKPLGEPLVALTSTVLKQLRLPDVFAEHRRQMGITDKALAQHPGFKVEIHGRKLSADEAERFLISKSSAAPRTGRPLHWTPSRLVEVARVYREAWIARKKPTEAVAKRFHLTQSGAAKVVKLARAIGLLPPTTQGKPGWIEVVDKKPTRRKKQ